jgi:G3E family GTPase
LTKVDIISGFLGAGKTTLIKKLLQEAFVGEKLVLIENEFGEIGIDGVILKDYGIEIKEMNSGCICCTIAGDFSLALKEILKLYQADRIIIEPSGVGKLSDVIKGCEQFIKDEAISLNICMTVVDGMKYNMYMKNFAEFYKDQIINAKTILLSKTQFMNSDAIEIIRKDIKRYNPSVMIVTTDWGQIDGNKIVELAENAKEVKLENIILKELYLRQYPSKLIVKALPRKINAKFKGKLQKELHHADEVFSVWGKETTKIYDSNRLEEMLDELEKVQGFILRAKGIIQIENNGWVQFDYVPGESTIIEAKADFTGRICVIGELINELELSKLFE